MTTKANSSSSIPSRKFVRGMIRHTPHLLIGTLLLFTLAAVVAGEMLGMYKALWWWDDMLHCMAGGIFGIIGFMLVYFLNGRYSMAISPLFIAVFAFTFAMTVGVLWEIFEFTVDFFLHTALQQWNLPANSILIGHSYQGSGLRDTMSDLIDTWIGASITSFLTYLIYKHKPTLALMAMRQTFPWRKR